MLSSSLPFLLLPAYCHPRDLLSFPPRRSSDLVGEPDRAAEPAVPEGLLGEQHAVPVGVLLSEEAFRSEEHTSELQSHVNLVCRLLLEKKNGPAVRLCDTAPSSRKLSA